MKLSNWKKERVIPISVQIYGVNVFFVLNYSNMDKAFKDLSKNKLHKFDKKAKEFYETEIGDRKFYGITFFNEANIIIFIPKADRTNFLEFFDTLAHETNHAVNDILMTVNIPLSDDTHESFAYLQGFLTRKVFEQIFEDITIKKSKNKVVTN